MIEIGSALDPGRKRIAGKNQDSLCVVKPRLPGIRPPMLVIADGMGGYEGGAIASEVVVNCFTEAYEKSRRGAAPLQILESGVALSLQALNEKANQDESLARMGSTVVAAICKGRSIYLLNVGDSRAYIMNEKKIQQISYDHSLVGEQLRQGMISEAEVRTHPRRNVLSMAVSVGRENVEPFSGVFTWRPGDYLVLCSDGLWGPVPEPQIQAVVIEYPPQQAAEKLVDLANTNLGPDNISVIVARLA